MAHPAVAVLESALLARKLDCTLTTARPAFPHVDPGAVVATGVSLVDRCLQGGLPRGELSELTGSCSSGRTTLLLQLIAAATRRGEIAAFIDTCDRLDVASAVAAGVDLDRLLWVRGEMRTLNSRIPSPEPDGVLDRALKAFNLVLQAGGFSIVAIDLADVPPIRLRQIPFTTWPRVQRAIEGSDTACVLLTPEPLARSAGGLTLLFIGRPLWAGVSDRSCRLHGVDVQLRVVSPRKRIDGDVRLSAVAVSA